MACGVYSLLYKPNFKDWYGWYASLAIQAVGVCMSKVFVGQGSATDTNWEPFHKAHIIMPHLIAPVQLALSIYLRNEERPL